MTSVGGLVFNILLYPMYSISANILNIQYSLLFSVFNILQYPRCPMSNVKWIHAPLVSQRMVSWAQLGAPAIKLELETIQSHVPLQVLGSWKNYRTNRHQELENKQFCTRMIWHKLLNLFCQQFEIKHYILNNLTF